MIKVNNYSKIILTFVPRKNNKPLTPYKMNTIETAKLTETKFFVEYVTRPSIPGFIAYYALVRTSDQAYLYANAELDNIWLYCFHEGISKNEVTLW